MSEECRVCVEAGVCRMRTVVTARDVGGTVEFEVRSDCPNVRRMKLDPVSPYTEVAVPFTESAVYRQASEAIPHTACPVPCAVVKAMEAVSGLCLKREVSIRFLEDGEQVDVGRRVRARTQETISNLRPSRTAWPT